MPTRALQRRSTGRSERTRERILAAVRELLTEGSFHEATVEQVAERAGLSRATLYQHFRSRLDLVDGICDRMGANPALVGLREQVELADVEDALARTLAHTIRFWASEDALLAQLYGVVAADPAVSDFVERQREDRRGEMERLARNLHRSGRLRRGLGERRALTLLMMLTSYETFCE